MKAYFQKSGRNKIHFRDGKPIPFELLGDARGVIVLDEDEDRTKVEDLRKYIADKIGGVVEVEKGEYEEVKKKFPFNPLASASKRNPARLLDTDGIIPKSVSPPEHAQHAQVRVSARAAGGRSHAEPAVEQGASEGSTTPPPISKGRPPRRRAAAASAPAEAPQVTEVQIDQPVPAPEPVVPPTE